MFENKKVTTEKVKDLIYNIYNEFENELDNELYENGYSHESNRLTTCEMIIDEVLERGV